MKLLQLASIIALAFSPLALADNASKVKLVSFDVLDFNENYIANFNGGIIKVDDTNNRLDVSYDILKDLPKHTEVAAEVFRSNSFPECANYEKISDYLVSLCTNQKHEYFKYLPDELIQLYSLGNGVPKGHYERQGHGTFKFYNLLSEEEMSNACFELIITIKSKNNIFLKMKQKFVSN